MAHTRIQRNANSLRLHGTELNDLIQREKYHVVCVQATFLKPGQQFKIPDYIGERRARLEGHRGGLMTFVRRDLEYSVLDNPENSSNLIINNY